jgi:DNA invertase Pin-like site-specific DNA recombinase
MISRPHQITDRHLRRGAIVYVRQSSPEQVRANIGSAAVQRDLAEKVAGWGWSRAMIEVLDDDLGISGSRPGARDGFNHLLDRMKADEIGLVAVVDASRLSRNFRDLFRFVDLAQRHDVLLAQGDQIIDWDDPNASFIRGILGLNAIRENRVRIQLSVQARRKKAEAGIAPTTPPVGYVRRPDGAWLKDPDPRVREVITLVFDKAVEIGSMRGVARYFRTHRIQVPRRRWRDRDRWQDVSEMNIKGFVQNPVYAGRYIFGRTRQEQPAEGSRKRGRQRAQPMSDWVVTDQHHEPYVDPARWDELQQRIAANRWPTRPPAGRGQALVQGLLRCRIHQKAFSTVYGDRRKDPEGRVERFARYICEPDRHSGDFRTHKSVVATWVDAIIERLLLETLTPVALDGIQEAVRQELRQIESLERGRHDEVRRAQQTAAEAERAYLDADPAHGHLKKRLADRLDQALQDLERLQSSHRLHPLVPPLIPDDATIAQLRQLLSELPRLWRHPSVTPAQRKAIARAAIKAIHVSPTPASWPLEVEWVGGARTALELTRQDRTRARPAYVPRRRLWPITLTTYQFIRDQVATGTPRRVIVDSLIATGARHPRGPWTLKCVLLAIGRLRKRRVPGVEPPPPLPALADHIRALYEQGYSPVDIVQQLQSQGTETRYRTAVTLVTVRAAMARLGLRPHSVVRDRLVCAHLLEWGLSTKPAEIASRLNALGLTTMHGRPWTSINVRDKLRDLGIDFVRQRRRSEKKRQGAMHSDSFSFDESTLEDRWVQGTKGDADGAERNAVKALDAEERV